MRFALALLLSALAYAQIPGQDTRNTEIPNTDFHFTARQYKTLADWQARREHLRKQVLSATGLMPMLPKNDLHPQIFGKIENRTYSIEKVLIEKALARHGGSVSHAAHALGLSRSALYRRLEKHGL